jgi:hypothetical protein
MDEYAEWVQTNSTAPGPFEVVTVNLAKPGPIGTSRDSLLDALRESVAVKQDLVDSLLAENVKLRRIIALYGAGIIKEVKTDG